MRLDKFISKATELSRKESKKILHASEVTVNDEVVKDPGLHVDIINDEVLGYLDVDTFDSETWEQFKIWMTRQDLYRKETFGNVFPKMHSLMYT